MRKPLSSRWVVIALVAGVVVLALTGIALLGAYFFLSRQTLAESEWVSPPSVLAGQSVAPDLAVLTLAGEPDDRVIRAALDAGELETAYATLAYSTLLPDSQRSGQWLLLGRGYQERDPARSAVAYQAALDLVALGPALNDQARADVALQAARAFDALDSAWISRLALAQAESIARFSLTLLPAQRRTLLGQVADAYRDLGDEAPAQSIRDNIDAYSAGPGVAVDPAPLMLPSLRGTVVLPSGLALAVTARQQAAAETAARWLSAGAEGRGTLAQVVGQALVAEDNARVEFYAQAPALPLADRLALLHDQVVWLTVKLRAARLGYGVSLVAEWEASQDSIASALSASYTDLINGYGQQLDTLFLAESAQARVELLRQGVVWTRLGLFPDHAEQILSEQLSEASRQLWSRQGNTGLTIVMQEARGRRFYLLAGSQPER